LIFLPPIFRTHANICILMISSTQILKRYAGEGVNRIWLYILGKAGILQIDKRIISGRAVNFYDEKKIEEILAKKKEIK